MKALTLVGFVFFVTYNFTYSQGCCSGGGGNPIAGGSSTAVLKKGQIEIALADKYSTASTFLKGDSPAKPFFDKLSSNYLFLRADYGLSDKFTFSTAVGYYNSRTIYEFRDSLTGEQSTISSKGIGDLILLPRYNLFYSCTDKLATEITVGLGMKIPLGKPNDSTFIGYSYFLNTQEPQWFIDSNEIWQTSPPTVQTTTGSNDLIATLYYMNEFRKSKFRVFANALYMRRGWNSLGVRFGDYASLGIYASKTLFKNLTLIGQVRGEWVGQMDTHEELDVLAIYNIDTTSTGSKALYFTPQINWNFSNGMTLFTLVDIPVYQYLRGTQIAMPYQFTAGISYRFSTIKDKKIENFETGSVSSGESINAQFKVWGNCGMCKDKIEKTIKALAGINSVQWDQGTLMLNVTYNEGSVSVDQMKEKLAEIGYDSETHRASKKAYDSLHSCCKYERP